MAGMVYPSSERAGLAPSRPVATFGSVGLAGLDLDLLALKGIAVLGGDQGIRTGFHIDGIGPERGFRAVG